ncbi:hypothetical protein H633G_11729 [Metarhizium anisopliae BRIP 53284]|nr:hypothetical protein H633G_11729 [Metarhizium anisopliae BRIP 53284]
MGVCGYISGIQEDKTALGRPSGDDDVQSWAAGISPTFASKILSVFLSLLCVLGRLLMERRGRCLHGVA